MPNIEIHGLELEESTQLKERIFNLFKIDGFVDEMVITTHPTMVENRYGTSHHHRRV